MSRERVVEGECPACGRKQKLCRHHCHTQDLVLQGYKEGLALLRAEPEVVLQVIRDYQTWAEDAVTVAVRRFEADWICRDCNSLDAVDPACNPHPGFSLSPAEMAEVRNRSGTCENFGVRLIEALRYVRYEAAKGFHLQAQLARAAGHSIAIRYWSEGKVDAVRSRLKLSDIKKRDSRVEIRPSGAAIPLPPAGGSLDAA